MCSRTRGWVLKSEEWTLHHDSMETLRQHMGFEGEERQPSETRQKARTWARESCVKKSEKRRTHSGWPVQGQWLCDQRCLGSWEHWFHGLYTSVGVPARKIFQRRNNISRDPIYYCKCISLMFLQWLFWRLGTLTLWNTQTTVKTHSFLIEVLSNPSYIEFSYFSINWSSMLL